MQTQSKRFNIVIRGRVQGLGFRELISSLANFLKLRGYVFNDFNGSVKLVLEGASSTVESFIEDIKIKTKSIGAEIQSLEKKEISKDFDLPQVFVKIPTTEFEEIGRKLDVGINIMREHTTLLKDLREGQDTTIDTQKKMLSALEKIGEKL